MTQRNDVNFVAGFGVRHKGRLQAAQRVGLDDVVIENFAGEGVQVNRGEVALKSVTGAGGDGFEGADAQEPRAPEQVPRHGVGDAGTKAHLDDVFGFVRRRRIVHQPPAVSFDHGIGQKLDGQSLQRFRSECAAQKIEIAHLRLLDTIHSQVSNLGEQVYRSPVHLTLPKNLYSIVQLSSTPIWGNVPKKHVAGKVPRHRSASNEADTTMERGICQIMARSTMRRGQTSERPGRKPIYSQGSCALASMWYTFVSFNTSTEGTTWSVLTFWKSCVARLV